MKLSPYQATIEQAYEAILLAAHFRFRRPNYAFNLIHWCPNHIIPRSGDPAAILQLPPSFELIHTISPFDAKEKLVQLATFQATYHYSITPMSPDMVLLILDTGTSISLTPYKADFITPIRPVQRVTIKGTVAGLEV